MAREAKLTPMMAQYRRIKSELPSGTLLLFRLGDFYEMFFEDAREGAQLLNVALTKRGATPMCGIPYHAANAYLSKLLKAGRKIAVCDQVEEAKPGRLVQREVTQILSPGAHFDERMLAGERNNYLAAVCVTGGRYGLALVDLTTGDFRATELTGEAALLAEIERMRPAEVLGPGEAVELRRLLAGAVRIVNDYEDWAFAPETAVYTLRDHFRVASLDGFGLRNRTAAVGAAGAVLHYLANQLRRDIAHLTGIRFYQAADYLVLDTTTLRNLEVLEPLHRDAPTNASLYRAVNRTVTPMGARRLRDWLSHPLASVTPIQRRQDAIAILLGQPAHLERLREHLREIRDLERTVSRLSASTGNARDLLALKNALALAPAVRNALTELISPGASTPSSADLAAWTTPDTLRESFAGDDPGELTPAANDIFGPVFPQLRGQPAAAVALLVRLQTGEAPGALSHPDAGDIDLVWGCPGTPSPRTAYGLARIAASHPESLRDLPNAIPRLSKTLETADSIQLESPTHRALLRANWKGATKRWLLTTFEPKPLPGADRGARIPCVRQAPPPPDPTAAHPADDRQTTAGSGPDASPVENDSGSSVALHDAPAPPLLVELTARLSECPEVVYLIETGIQDEPPISLKEGGMIRDGFDAALDELRQAGRAGKDWIAKLQRDEIERTGIQSLKVRYNAVFGYFIEVTKANLEKVPADYVRKQTIANGERYFTPQLKEMESKILGAEERAAKLEYELFLTLRERALERLAEIQQTASVLGELDVLAGLAEVARLQDYTRPEVRDAGELQIRDGRHPVLEQTMTEERFVPNDIELGGERRVALITGPNMAGKSTYIRQAALLALLAHTGSFVPAASARVDLVDRIFTRIGASDDLARGQSTFMVEMSETANILRHATAKSLVILDEIGRGTSTFDGLSLAWSIVEHLHNQIGAKTLFATHYHELTELAGKLKRVHNYNVAVREWNDQIVFLRKIVEGGADKSYGIQVARLAGVPRPVIDRAKIILGNLEDSELTPEGNVRRATRSRHRAEREKLRELEPPPQLDLFA